MGLALTVQHDTREACEEALALACRLLGLVVVLPPMRPVGGDRWMARARPAQWSAPTGTPAGR